MSSKKKLVPGAKSALEQLKMEAASEVGVNLTNGYNGELTSVPGRFVGGQMVSMIPPYELFPLIVRIAKTAGIPRLLHIRRE